MSEMRLNLCIDSHDLQGRSSLRSRSPPANRNLHVARKDRLDGDLRMSYSTFNTAPLHRLSVDCNRLDLDCACSQY